MTNEVNSKSNKNRKIAWIIVLCIVTILIILKVVEFNYSNFTTGEINDKEVFPITLTSSGISNFEEQSNNLTVLSSSEFDIINQSGDFIVSNSHGFSNPVKYSNDSYTLLIDQGSKGVKLFNKTELLFDKTLEKPIICANINEKGDFIIVTYESANKNQIIVYNKYFNEKTTLEVKGGYITNVCLSNNSNKIAYALSYSENGSYYCKTVCYDLNKYKTLIESTHSSAVISYNFSSNNLYVIGREYISVITSSKKEKVIYGDGSVKIENYLIDSSNNAVVMISGYEGSSSKFIVRINNKGKIKNTISVNSDVYKYNVFGNYLYTMNSKSISKIKWSNSETIEELSLDEMCNDFVIINGKIYTQHSTLINVLKESK